jgi:hypothetical protein
MLLLEFSCRKTKKSWIENLSAYPLHRDLDPAADLIHDAGGDRLLENTPSIDLEPMQRVFDSHDHRLAPLERG